MFTDSDDSESESEEGDSEDEDSNGQPTLGAHRNLLISSIQRKNTTKTIIRMKTPPMTTTNLVCRKPTTMSSIL